MPDPLQAGEYAVDLLVPHSPLKLISSRPEFASRPPTRRS